MPRPKKDTDKEPKKRSRTGCWPCKARKVKCGEEKPACLNCTKTGEHCDYSIRLNWGGRSRRDNESHTSTGDHGQVTFVTNDPGTSNAVASLGNHPFSAQHIIATPPQTSAEFKPDRTLIPHASQPKVNSLDPALLAVNAGASNSTEPASILHNWRRSPILPNDFPTELDQQKGNLQSLSQHRHKRLKSDSTIGSAQDQNYDVGDTALHAHDIQLSGTSVMTPPGMPLLRHDSAARTPTTPDANLVKLSPHPSSQYAPDLSDLRRLSVRSLLSDPSEDAERPYSTKSEGHGYRTYGYDHGLPDVDIPRNDDFAVLLSRPSDIRRPSAVASDISTSSGEPDVRPVAFEPGGYYAQPVPVKIPKALEPLPAELRDNPMNLLYYHHFINHTGRILVVHDCPENPFRGILPQMAVRNTQLLHLLLSFSASHRARLLGHPEPLNRIAQWMADVLPALRRALDEPSPMSPGPSDLADPTSLAPLAIAIMLASLEVVSPSLSSISIPWYSHLSMARRLIIATGGLDQLAQRADGVRDRAIFFLSRWFAYLDVLGALSDCRLSIPLYDAYLEDGGGRWLVNRRNEEIYQIDCLFGFSGRCIALLAQVAELANRCDNDRIDPITNVARTGWEPSTLIRQQAADLERRLIASAATVYRGCTHHVNAPGSVPGDEPTPRQTDEDVAELYATNEAFHWAGLIQLSRRVYALPSSHSRVQELVARTTQALRQVREGSTAEGCLLYPSFCAGVEAQDAETRAFYADRLQNTERWGIGNFRKARKVMQSAWETGLPWEVLTEGEFLG